ncbi:MAG: hypothetical protein V4726_17870 [Verrucomicrobiota bacterium]
MKPHLPSVLCGSLLTVCAIPVISSLQAQVVTVSPATPVPVQYKIITAGQAPDGRVLEAEINRMAAQGWRVRTSVMAGVVMEKE